MGKAILDYYKGERNKQLLISSSVEKEGPMEIGHFFRDENTLPELEKIALANCRGKILDVGAGAGCHSIILQERGFEVHPIEISAHAVEVMRAREIQNVRHQDFATIENEGYDTILLLMNGFGLGESKTGLEVLLKKAKTLLNPGGQIIADSADIIYAYQDDEDAVYLDLNAAYYGEISYSVSYDGATVSFPWLFVDYFMADEIAQKAGLNFELLTKGEYYNYLCRLSIM